MAKRIKINRKKLERGKLKNIEKVLCIILKEGKGSAWLWVSDKENRFDCDENTYFIITDGTYLGGALRFLVYLEGISTPINHGYIDREQKKVKIIDRDTGQEVTRSIDVIKGLKFDSKLIDILLNRGLADEFTKNHMDLPNLIIIILLIAGLIVGIINIVMWFI